MNDHTAIAWQEVDDAGFMSLDVAPASPEACSLINALMQDVVMPSWPLGTQQRPKALAKHSIALAVFFGELQRLGLKGSLGKHGMSDGAFVGQPFGRDVFKRTADALRAAGLLSMRGGWRWTGPGFVPGGKPVKTGSTVTTFGLTDAGRSFAAAHGVEPDRLASWREHWSNSGASAGAPIAGPLVDLKGAKESNGGPIRSAAKYLPVNPSDPHVRRMTAELEAHNTFVAQAGVEGVNFSGLKRVFNNGDLDGFRWQWGGRFASRGPAGYDGDAKADRLENMRIGGEPIVQLDLRASHLTILYGILGWPLDPEAVDPYYVGELDRGLVKRVVAQTIGRGDTKARNWSAEAFRHYGEIAPGRALATDLPFRPTLDQVLAAHPILGLVGAEGRTVHDLNYHESEIMMQTMTRLRAEGIATLPVHDCLIVPRTSEVAAKQALRQTFLDYLTPIASGPVQAIPALTVE